MRKLLQYQLVFSLLILLVTTSLSAFSKGAERLQLVFIFKSESSINQGFYQSAFNYYRSRQTTNPNLIIIRNVDSLQQVVEVVNNQKRKVHSIVLVSHASHWSGLSIPITEHSSHKTTSSTLLQFLDDRSPLIKQTVYSQAPKIIIEGCGIGSSQTLLKALSRFFTSHDGIIPEVSAPKGYMLFYYLNNPVKQNKEFLKTEIPIWEVSIPFSKSYDYQSIVNQFSVKYGDSIPWDIALEFPHSSLLQNDYTYKKRTITLSSYGYKSDIDKFNSKLDYIKKHKSIKEQLDNYGIGVDRFSWEFDKSSRPGVVKITGRSLTITVFDSSQVKKAR
ncbi:MAG: hypothetical protein OQJ95_07320 [Kangiella sp.]|jgi:hypothetical protein|nr:hypothetical protein [Kangiella sp.]